LASPAIRCSGNAVSAPHSSGRNAGWQSIEGFDYPPLGQRGLTIVKEGRKLIAAATAKRMGEEGKDTQDNLAESDCVRSNVADSY
jgi:hypothetical protein